MELTWTAYWRSEQRDMPDEWLSEQPFFNLEINELALSVSINSFNPR